MIKRKYRLLGILSVIMVIIAGFCLNKMNFFKLLSDVINTTAYSFIYPLCEYSSSPENIDNKGTFERMVGEMFPSGQYYSEYISSTDYMQFEDDNGHIISVDNENVINITADDNNQNENKTSPTDEKSPSQSTDIDAASVTEASDITGNVYSKEDLKNYDFVHSRFYTITSITSLTKDILRPDKFIEKDMSITHDNSTPQILIFHTHSQESFVDSREGEISDTIVGVGDYLTDILSQKYGYNVIHDRSVYDYVDGKLDRSKAYTYAEEGIAQILQENPSIEVVIDLHRDGVAESTRLVTNVNGKQTAKIMFFNGISYSNVKGDIGYLYNPYRDDNLAMSLQMHLLGEAYYPGFLRRIYINAYRYCLHERAKSTLIEAGAQTNTVEEVKNAMEPLADILNKMLTGQKAY